MVRRAAVRALGFLGTANEIPRLNAMMAEDSAEPGQVRAVAREALKRLTDNSFESTEALHERKVREAARKYKLSGLYNDTTHDKAWSLVVRSPPFPAWEFAVWDAAVRWIVSHEPENRITEMIAEVAPNLRFRVLQDFDYRLYCPEWWRNAMDEQVQ